MTPKFWTVSLPAYVYGLGTPLPRLSLCPSSHTVHVRFFLFLLSVRHRISVSYALAQTLCGICSSTLCVLNYYCHFIDGDRIFWPPIYRIVDFLTRSKLIFIFFAHTLSFLEIGAIVIITSGIVALVTVERHDSGESLILIENVKKYRRGFIAITFPILY